MGADVIGSDFLSRAREHRVRVEQNLGPLAGGGGTPKGSFGSPTVSLSPASKSPLLAEPEASPSAMSVLPVPFAGQTTTAVEDGRAILAEIERSVEAMDELRANIQNDKGSGYMPAQGIQTHVAFILAKIAALREKGLKPGVPS